jgi:hypothetical protein
MTPKDAYLALSGMVHQDGNQVACEGLLDWLRATLTRRRPGLAPRTAVPPLSAPVFQDLQDQRNGLAYCLSILHQDLPHTLPGVQHISAVLIAQGLSNLTQEQRIARKEATAHRQTCDAHKTPADYFSVLLERLMRWCQVADEADLPPIYETLANTKKGKIRVAATLAAKITAFKWHSHLPDDFTVGLNIFNFGSMDEEAMEELWRINQHYDAITSNNAAPSLTDLPTIQDHKHDFFIPKTLTQLRYSVERSQSLWHVLLGSSHPITKQHQAYKAYLSLHEKRMERVVPRDICHLHLVPALLARLVQVDVNHWLVDQARLPAPISVANMTDVFHNITRARQWEPTFPSRYLSGFPVPSGAMLPTAISIGSSATSIADTALTTPSTLPPSAAPSVASTSSANTNPGTIVRNPAYNVALFGEHKAKGIKTGKLKAALHARGNIKVPRNPNNVAMCIPYHVIGMCNTPCNSVADHAPHSEADDSTLSTWCAKHYHLD